MKTFFSQWRVLLTLCAVGIFFAPEGRAESPDSLPKPTSYVADFAGVIDASSKESLEAYCLQVYTKAHATIEVVTVKSLDGLQIDDFTTQLQAKWRVGPKKTDRGIVMVFAIQDHKWRIEVGYGLEGLLNDAKAGDMGRDMVPQLKQGQYGQAALLGIQELGNVIATDAGVTLDAPPPVHTYHRENVRRSRGSSWPVWIFVALFVFSLLGRRRGGGGGGFPWWLFFLNGIGGGGGGRGGWDNDGGGGGSSGGNSGGSDFGGGFGGDSGGGGASGDW